MTACSLSRLAATAAACLFVAAASPLSAQSSRVDKLDIERGHAMLRHAHDEVQSDYFDPKFGGIDIDARMREYDKHIDSAQSLSEILRVVAAYLSGFHDSHLFFFPPSHATTYKPDYTMDLVGNRTFITHVKAGTDAASKMSPGDEVLLFQGYNVNREDYHDVEYAFRLLGPLPAERFKLGTAHGPSEVDVKAESRREKRVLDLTDPNAVDLNQLVLEEERADAFYQQRVVTLGNMVVWKIPQFDFSIDLVDAAFKKAEGKALVLDLRGNPGGVIRSLQFLLGRLFDHDVKIADRVGRKSNMKPEMAKHYGKAFTGKLVVLVDGSSASCSELLARVVQLEHRGTVIGDRSAGAVMEAQQFRESIGNDTIVPFGFSITYANLIMTDGKSLEKVGVQPDELLLPTPEDLAAERDPVLARAAELVDQKLSSAVAGKLFPFKWLN